MSKSISKIAILIAGLLLVAMVIITPLAPSGSAYDLTDGVYYGYEFNEGESIPSDWDIVSYDDGSTVAVENGALAVNNISANSGYDGAYTNTAKDYATEIKLPELFSENYAIEFDFTRIAGNGSISIKYAIQEDGAGYEFRIPMLQADNGHAFWYNHNAGMEYRKVLPGGSVEDNIDKYRFYNLNYYESEFFVNQTYHFAFLRYEGRNRLFINGAEYLKHDDNNKLYVIGENGSSDRYETGDLILRFNRVITANIDNLIVKTPQKYLNDRVMELGDTSTWDNQKVIDNALNAKNLVAIYDEVFSETERVNSSEYETVTDIWQRYATINAPTLNLTWTGESVAPGTTVDFGAMVTAVDYTGRALAVDIEVIYGGNYLLVNSGKATLNEKGSYTVRFTAYDVNGFSSSLERTLTVA